MAIIKHLIADEFGTHIGKYSERLRLTRIGTKEKLGDYPLLHLEAVLVTRNGVSFSADAVRVCAERGIPIFFLSGRGIPYATLYSAGLTGTVATRRAQLLAYEDERGLKIARAFIRGKVQNQVNLVRYMAKYRKEREAELFEELQQLFQEIADPLAGLDRISAGKVGPVRDELLGIEGRAAQKYWQAIRLLLKADLDWPGRETRGAGDPLNMALNYGYGVLYGQVERAIVLAGLDPYAGFLHADRPGKPSLVLDLIEEFRQQVVDRTVIGLVNKKVPISLDKTGRLDKKIRRTLAEKVLERLESPVRYEKKRHPIRAVLQSQARHLATFLRGEREEYEPFVGSW